ncbi:MAG TPA: hypothetical protein VJ732_17565 [Bryobacteraceae bacterium]|nr:hypothetical protein [Bryobacteraceae bacterium]
MLRRRPITHKRLAANRANAAKSTGPRTPEGKARSAQNARKHGFTASSFAVVRLEELDEITRLKADLVAVYEPVNSQELFALERMALAQQAILRSARLEAGLFTDALDETLIGDEPFIRMCKELAGDGDIRITRPRTATSPSAKVFIASRRNPTAGRCSSATRPSPSASTAEPWRNSTASKSSAANYRPTH